MRMMRQTIRFLAFIALGVLMLGATAFQAAAQRTVSGKVTEADGAPLGAATVLEVGTQNGTVADFDGNYTLQVSSDTATLRFSLIGFQTVERKVGGQSTINVTLQEETELLDQVVVTALGFEERKDELGYANTEVEGERLTQSGEPTLLNSLQGKSSGVRISRNSGDPGAGAYIQIRGVSSITRDSQPLIVVDGVPISNDVRGNSDRSGVSEQSRLNDLNPNDIKDVTILKGASAAALWGTKALGGAIIITTKRGDFNSKLEIKYRTTYSIDVINRRYPLQDEFGQGDNGVYSSTSRDSWGDRIADRPGGPDEFNTSGMFFVDQDGRTYYPISAKNSRETFDDENFDEIFQNGHFWENNLSISGGGENTAVFFSVSDMNQEGIIRNNSDYRRSTIRFNLDQRFNDWMKLQLSSNYTRTNANRILKGATSSGLYLGLLRNAPDFDISGYRGDYYAGPDAAPEANRHRSYRNPLGEGGAIYNNPLWTINEQENLALVNRFINSFKLTVSPLEWVDLIARVGVDHYSEKRNEFFTPGSASGAYSSGFYEQSTATNTIINSDLIAKGQYAFNENFDASLLLGFNYNVRQRSVNGARATNFTEFIDESSHVRTLDNSDVTNIEANNFQLEERTAGLYSSLTLNAFQQLFVTGTMRAEYASTFGDDAGEAFYFPSVSVAWQFTEAVEIDKQILSFGKVRFSYGEVGVQPAAYNTSNLYVRPDYGDTFGGDLSLGLYGGIVPSVERGNSSLKPERKKEFEVGMDLRFLNDRVSLGVTYFDNVTEDVLLNLPIANSRGYSRVYTNAGELANYGWEVELGGNVLKVGDFSWDVSANYTRVRNEVTDLVGEGNVPLGGLSAVDSRAVEGEPMSVLWGSRTLRDDEGNMVFDENGFPVQDDEPGVIGDPNPDWQGALTTTFRYKKFTLMAMFETFQGADIYAGTKSVLSDMGRWENTANVQTATRNYKTFDGDVIFIGEEFRGNIKDFGAGPVALTEAWYNGDGGFFGNGNDELYVEDGSWTRLRELRLSYRMDMEALRTIGLNSVELSVTGRNLIIWTPFEGNDPDTNLSGVSAARGIDYFNNPGTQSYLFTAQLTF